MLAEPRSFPAPRTEAELAALCGRLGAARVSRLTARERGLIARGGPVARELADATRAAILAGDDPLGRWFSALRTPRQRRRLGATYTPAPIIEAMIGWARGADVPSRVVDPGAGSGRFLREAARAFPDARLIAVDVDPLAALMCRATLEVLGLGGRAEVRLGDYRRLRLPAATGPTLFVGNPPYVRHHDIDPRWKRWLADTAERHGLRASRLAGLHVHFFLATLQRARPGDLGAFITAGEWLDVNYGRLVRELLVGPLGLDRLDLLDPRARAFDDAQTTAAIACFRVGSAAPTVRVRGVDRPDRLGALTGGRAIRRDELRAASRWSTVRRCRDRAGRIELGELCRVHRGQVTGANAVWIAGPDTPPLPAALRQPTITRARELFAAGAVLASADHLRRVVELPAELDALDDDSRAAVDRFLAWARAAGADQRYIARHRAPWWSVRLRAPAPILATYMARRPPAFVRNLVGARHINIAHGLYPREPMPAASLDALARYLCSSVSTDDGRTYAGGLTKFEPREMERLLVPTPAALAAV